MPRSEHHGQARLTARVWRQVDAQVLERDILPAFGSDKPADDGTQPGTGYPSKSRQTDALA